MDVVHVAEVAAEAQVMDIRTEAKTEESHIPSIFFENRIIISKKKKIQFENSNILFPSSTK